MLDVAHYCLQHKNYSAVMEIVNGFNNPSLSRLQFFWERIKEDSDVLRLSRLRMLNDSVDTYKKYLNSIMPGVSCLPSLTVTLKDLALLHLSNKSILSDGIINTEKILSMYNVIDNFLKVL